MMRSVMMNPMRTLDLLQREINRAFSEFGREEFPGWTSQWPWRFGQGFPRLNVSENDTNVYVEALVPGFDPKDIEISVLGKQLTISGRREGLAEKEGVKIHRSELASGQFVRVIDLPAEVDAENVSANYKNGVLTITLAKSPSARPRQIPVQIQ